VRLATLMTVIALSVVTVGCKRLELGRD